LIRPAQRLTFAGAVAAALVIPGVAAVAQTGWIDLRISRALAMRAPPGTTFRTTPAKDSFVGVLEGAGFTLSLDFGSYSAPITASKALPGATVQAFAAGGHPAEIVTAPLGGSGPPYRIALHVSDISRSSIGETSLTIAGTAQTASALANVEQMLRSVMFQAN
jgi:hypothetical protein